MDEKASARFVPGTHRQLTAEVSRINFSRQLTTEEYFRLLHVFLS